MSDMCLNGNIGLLQMGGTNTKFLFGSTTESTDTIYNFMGKIGRLTASPDQHQDQKASQ